MCYKYYFIFALLFIFLESNSQNVTVDSSDKKAKLDSFMQDLQNQREKRKSETIGKVFTHFTVYEAGKKITNKNLEHKVVFINFWFASCKPCIDEFEELNNLFTKFKSDKSFKFMSFSFDTPEMISRTRQKYKLKFKSYSISQLECRKLNQNFGFPTSILIGKDGTIKQLYIDGISEKNIEAVCIDILRELNNEKH